jgi:hypothetical protein
MSVPADLDVPNGPRSSIICLESMVDLFPSGRQSMNVPRRIIGFLAVLIGVAGTALAVLGVYHTWRLHSRLRTQMPSALQHADVVVRSVQQQGQATNALLETTRLHLTSIREPISQLALQNQLDNAAILQTVDQQLLNRLESVEHFSLSMQNSIRGMSSALLILDSMPFLTGRPRRNRDEMGQWKTVAVSLTDTADLLGQVNHTLSSIRTGQNVSPQQLNQLADALNRIDGRLEEVQTHIARFNELVEGSSSQLDLLEGRIPQWLERSAIVMTAFFVCFGSSQLGLAWMGFGGMTRASDPKVRELR